MADFEPCFNKVIIIEGGYKLHTVKGDRGGMTYAGIARKKWPAWAGWNKIDIGMFDAELTQLVRDFYRINFWNKIKGDKINSQKAAYHIYEFAINSGISASVRIAQRIIGAVPDGIFGPKSLSKLNQSIIDSKDERIFIVTFSLLKVFRYKNICMNDDRRKKDELESNLKFICGWINRVEKGLE